MLNKNKEEQIQYLINSSVSHIGYSQFDDAIKVGISILNIDNNNTDAMYILASAYMHKDDFSKAIFYIEKVLEIDPLYVGAYIVLAYVYKKQMKIDEEIELLKTVINLIIAEQDNKKEKTLYHKSLVEAWSLLGSAYTLINETTNAVEAFIKCSLLEENKLQKLIEYSNALFTANYSEKFSPEEKYSLHVKYNDFFDDIQKFEYNFKINKKKIRIGYISPDFRQHAVSFFSYSMLADFNKDFFEVYCYAKGNEDNITLRLKGIVDKWQNVSNLSHEDIAKLIYADNIDILLDLAGHTAHSLLPVMAYKPAPIQISGIGYFNTTGLKTVDYFLTDINCDPVGKNDELFSEKLLRLTHSHFCYSPLINMGEVSALPAVKNNYITFGSFNNFNKVTDEMLVVWNTILEKVPNSKLVLKSKIFNTRDGIKFVVDKMNKIAMPIDRIDLRGFSSDYLEQYADVDIALDTYPYQGGATTCEALYMGVPVVTLVGESHGSRFGYSLLKNAGLEELICYTADEYIEKSLILANNIELLVQLRASLRSILNNSSLMNSKQYMSELEEKYILIYKKFVNRESQKKKNYINYNDIKSYLNKGDYTNAIVLLRENLNSNSNDIQALCDIVSCYIELNDLNSAQAYGAYLKELAPTDMAVLFLNARICYMSGDFESTIYNLTKALSYKKTENNQVLSLSYNLLGNTYKLLCDARESSKAYLAASKYSIDLTDKLIDYSNYLFNLNYLADISLDEISAEHLKYNDFFQNIKPYKHEFKPKGKIRVGYISPDLREHVVLNFSYAFFNNYDKSVFEVYCYAYGKEDDYSIDIKNKVDNWRNITEYSYSEIAELIYQDNIDILVDLAGHSKNNLLPVLAYKPAPILISGIGYFNTTGLKSIDYYLSDIYCENEGLNDKYFSEKMLILPETHWCYSPLKEFPDINKKNDEYVVFGSFNNFTKTSDEILLLWKEILQRVDKSKLVLKSNIFSNDYGVKKISNRLINLGFDLERVELRPESRNYLEEYNDINIALDTYPYVGGGTTCEALYMGTPVITLVGDRHGSRFGYSILKNIGLDDCIAFSREEYIEKAVDLAQDKARLKYLNIKIRDIMNNSPLTNALKYIKAVEKIFIEISANMFKKQENNNFVKNNTEKYFYDDFYKNLKEKKYNEILKKLDFYLDIIVTDEILIDEIMQYIVINENYENTDCYINKIISKKKDYFRGYYIKAETEARKLNFDKAIDILSISRLNCNNITKEQEYYLYSLIGKIKATQGNVNEAIEVFKKTISLADEISKKVMAYDSYLFYLNCIDTNKKDIYIEHCKYGELFPKTSIYNHKNKNGKKIKIGYVSPDFRNHIVMFFSYAMLANYDKTKFEVYCYFNGVADHITDKVKILVDRWHNVGGCSVDDVATLIKNDGIDILVDLAGHTGGNLLPVFAKKPAPIQISGIGYFNTTGLNNIDYYLSDYYCDPLGKNKDFFTEKVLRMPSSHFCYSIIKDMPIVKEKDTDKIVFGSFNNFSKINDEILCCWLEIINKVENSKIVIKNALLCSPSEKIKFQTRLRQLGYGEKQFELREASIDYLDEYNEINIALDTYPYLGGGTTCEALYMGVPVITLVGDRHGARFGYSILKNIGLDCCIAFSKKEYIEKAVELASNIGKLKYLNKNLRSIMDKSPLMNAENYMRELEKLYELITMKYFNNKKYNLNINDYKKKLSIAVDNNDYNGILYWSENLLIEDFFNGNDFYILSWAAYQKQEYKKAIFFGERALLLRTKYDVEVYFNLGCVYKDLLEYSLAEKKFKEALNNINYGKNDFIAMLYQALAGVQIILGKIIEARINYKLASETAENFNVIVSNYSSYLMTFHYNNKLNDIDIYEEHLKFSNLFKQMKKYTHINKPKQIKTRIGYISPDFRKHVMFNFYHSMLKYYDKNKFEVICYSINKPDENTFYLKGLVDKWVDISNLSYQDSAEIIYKDEIDILVDLAGHTANNGLPILAYKPAPIQISGLGYFHTTGLDTVDYFLTDFNLNPDFNQANFIEKLIPLPNNHLCYSREEYLFRKKEYKVNDKIIYASFNNYSKITDEILKIWLQIINKVPNSIILLKSQVFSSMDGYEKAISRMLKLGFDIKQIILRPATADYMEEYLHVDIALDTYPYPGGGTTCDALYMGVPVISLVGENHLSRFGYSFLKNIGLEELAVFTPEEYIEKAVALAKDKEILKIMHNNLQGIMMKSNIMNQKQYVSELENAYKEIMNE